MMVVVASPVILALGSDRPACGNQLANNVRYGLAAALETADRLEAGNVWINSYFNLASGSPVSRLPPVIGLQAAGHFHDS